MKILWEKGKRMNYIVMVEEWNEKEYGTIWRNKYQATLYDPPVENESEDTREMMAAVRHREWHELIRGQ